MTRLSRIACALSLAGALSSCLTVDHFPGDASRYDGLFFAPENAAPLEPALKDSQWRNYAIFGLVSWDGDQTRYAGTRLGEVGSENRPMRMVVHTEQSFVNGLTSFGLGLLGGILAPLLFVPRTTEVTGWNDG